MFQNDKKQITVPTIETTQVTVPTFSGLKKAVVPAVTGAAAAAKQRGNDQARSVSDLGRKAAETASSQVSNGRDTVENSRLAELVADARESASERNAEVADQVKTEAVAAKLMREAKADKLQGAVKAKKAAELKEAKAKSHTKNKTKGKKKGKKGGLFGSTLTWLGALALAGAVVAYMKKKNQPKDDPWARPLTDPYVAPTTGHDSGTATTGTVTSGTAPETGTSSFSRPGAADVTSTSDVTTTPQSDLGDTPSATLAEGDVVDLTDGGLPPEDGTTLGEALGDDKNRRH